MQHGFQRDRAGFTLIELLAVLLILSILTYFLVNHLMGGTDAVKVGVARNKLAQIATMLGQLSDDKGGYPASQLSSDIGSANTTNVGSEALYVALCAEGAPGFGTLDKDKDLCNTDNDHFTKIPKGIEKPDLYEIADPWGNPIAYIASADYDREFHYVTSDGKTGEEVESAVRAAKSAKTGRFAEPHGFQLISAGPDGRFGGEQIDDITNFQTK